MATLCHFLELRRSQRRLPSIIIRRTRSMHAGAPLLQLTWHYLYSMASKCLTSLAVAGGLAFLLRSQSPWLRPRAAITQPILRRDPSIRQLAVFLILAYLSICSSVDLRGGLAKIHTATLRVPRLLVFDPSKPLTLRLGEILVVCTDARDRFEAFTIRRLAILARTTPVRTYRWTQQLRMSLLMWCVPLGRNRTY